MVTISYFEFLERVLRRKTVNRRNEAWPDGGNKKARVGGLNSFTTNSGGKF
jgi:hypothetical protein